MMSRTPTLPAPPGAEAAAAKDAVRGIYTSGLGGLKQQLEAAK